MNVRLRERKEGKEFRSLEILGIGKRAGSTPLQFELEGVLGDVYSHLNLSHSVCMTYQDSPLFDGILIIL